MEKPKNLVQSNAACRCQQLSTADSDKIQAHWYKQMYCELHKTLENKKDVILVKLPPTPSRYREYYQQQDEQQNPYQPTYKFPEKLGNNLERMENYMRKVASQNIDDDECRNISASPTRTASTMIRDSKIMAKRHTEKIIRFDDQLLTPNSASSTEHTILNNEDSVASNMISSRPNANYHQPKSSTADNEQKLIYKRILRGGDIPSVGLQKFSANNRETSNDEPNESHDCDDHDRLQLNQQNLSPQTNDHQPIYKALASHTFYAENNRELSFKKGDTILVKRRINDDWFEGEHQGVTGIFPVNHVELFPYDPMENKARNEKESQIEGEAIVKSEFIPKKAYELELKKGDRVILLRRLDNNWYEGRLNQLEGIFPADCVKTLREPIDQKLKMTNQTEHTKSNIKVPNSALKNSTHIQKSTSEDNNTASELSLSIKKCQVLYDYTPKNPDELEIHVGDIINIVEMCDDGWYCGIMEKSNHGNNMEFGTFPGNYVKILSS